MDSLKHLLVQCSGTDDSFLNALCELSDSDCDFNGENGPDYLYEDAKKAGMDSNLDYIIDVLKKDIEGGLSHIDALEKFIDYWLGKDSYYKDYSLEYLTNEKGEVRVISLAILS